MSFRIREDNNNQLIFEEVKEEELYKELGCGIDEDAPFVMHGPPTELLKKLREHLENWAIEKLKDMQPSPSRSGRFAMMEQKSEELLSPVENPVNLLEPRGLGLGRCY